MICFFCSEHMVLDKSSGLWECPLYHLILNTLNMTKIMKKQIEQE